MPRVLSEQYITAEHASATSSGTSNVQTLAPTSVRAVGVWITVEGSFAARVTFDGTTPGVAAPPGLLIPTATPPLFYPFAFTPSGQNFGGKVKFASNGAGNSIVSVAFVT